MNKKKGGKTAAVIDIGSNMLRMQISQLRKGAVFPVDRLEYPVTLGHEVFTSGKISFESLRELTGILRGFSNVMAEYGVEDYQVVATTALREAHNKTFITDQLKIQNNMNVSILEDNQEKSLIFSSIFDSLQDVETIRNGTSLVTHIGTGTIGFSVYSNGTVAFSQNIPLGALKLHDKLGALQNETDDFYTVISEYVNLIIQHIAITLPEMDPPISNLVITGSATRTIASLCGVPETDGNFILTAKQIKKVFKEMRSLTTEKLSLKYGITEEAAELLYSSLAIYVQLIEFTKAATVIAPRTDLCSTLVRFLLQPKSAAAFREQVRANAISCARETAENYGCNRSHAEQVRLFGCQIFDKMKKAHGLDQHSKLLLEVASILHDSGYYVNSKQHLSSTFDLIKNMDVYGLTDEETLYIAYVARYTGYESDSMDEGDVLYLLSDEKQLLVSKLTAIFRLADSLDKSQKQKFSSIKVKLEHDRLLITAETDVNPYLEKWAFGQCAVFFKEVFGITPELIVKSAAVRAI